MSKYVEIRTSYDIIIARDSIGIFTIILGSCLYVSYMFQGVIDLGKVIMSEFWIELFF